MAQIQVTDLTYDVFKDVSFSIDTDWKLGLIGRNGRGKNKSDAGSAVCSRESVPSDR